MHPPFTRRQMLLRSANGFGAVALMSLLTERDYGGALQPSGASNPLAPRPTHHAPKATSVIFLYMDGGPSQVDTFDPKPRLQREDGRPIGITIPRTQFIPHNSAAKVLGSPFRFKQYGQSGIPVSGLFPKIAECVDDIAVVRSMVANFPEHTNATLFLHTGVNQQGRPSMGAWVTYGLGSACQDLPGYVVLKSGRIPSGGADNFSNGFLPATYQGSVFRDSTMPVANLQRTEATEELQKGKLELLNSLDREVLARLGSSDRLESAIANYELAFRMQTALPDLLDVRGETAATRRLYGLDETATQSFGGQCLLARRLVERGVRFIELTCPEAGTNRWDAHSNLETAHGKMARAVDQPIAGLIKDLKARGLLDRTLILWGGEFGRTPVAQGTSNGRDHNPYGFSMWLAGGGVKGGTVYGATDDYGYHAIENKVEIHDLHATILHLLGIDHKRLTYRFGGRDMRLTDVRGDVVEGILA